MQEAKGIIRETCREFEGLFVRDYHGLVEAYKTEDAEIVVTGMGSVVGVLRDMVDEYSEKGHKIGMLKVSCASYPSLKGAERFDSNEFSS